MSNTIIENYMEWKKKQLLKQIDKLLQQVNTLKKETA